MTEPHIMRCPDGHYRRSLFELGPFIADYPEQVCLAGIVSGWCPKCVAVMNHRPADTEYMITLSDAVHIQLNSRLPGAQDFALIPNA